MSRHIQLISEAADTFLKLALESSDCAVPASNPKVTDGKDHYPIATEAHAKSVLAKVTKFTNVPTWWKGTLPELVKIVTKNITSKYKTLAVKK